MEQPIKSRVCFVIMKFGEKNTDDYLRQQSIYEDIIKPAVEEAGLGYLQRADDIMKPGSVVKDIVQYLANADVVIADLTHQNPNVFYELGVRHALRGRVIMLTQSTEDIPFDLRNYRVVQYTPDSPAGFRQVTTQIRQNLRQLVKDEHILDSPILDTLSERFCPKFKNPTSPRQHKIVWSGKFR